MTLSTSFKKVVFQNYCNFNGRASRGEFWWFVLATMLIGILCTIVSLIIGDDNYLLGGLVNLLLLLPSLGVTWRRLHDTGKGGGWFFVSFIPIIGWIWLLILLINQSELQPNRFGDVPTD